jgi:hypothetical protein
MLSHRGAVPTPASAMGLTKQNRLAAEQIVRLWESKRKLSVWEIAGLIATESLESPV